jgi:magnesium-protoporphyrin O-methyltransferase
VPPRCCEPDYDALFDERAARRELAAYQRNGPTGTTRRLIEAIRLEGVVGASVLDIGGGVGIIGAELLGCGASTMTDVDASHAYAATARAELERRGFGDRISVRHGDFVRLAGDTAPADIVTLDRVVCCYGDWATLIDRSTERAHRLIGLVYPNDRWWMRLVVGTGNLVIRLFRQQFRFYIHPEREIDARIRGGGFERHFRHRSIGWQTVLYRRVTD